MSTNRFGEPDLDGRPPNMARSTMSAWLHECEHCGYPFHEREADAGDVGPALESKAYRALDAKRGDGRFANRCLRRALIDEYWNDSKEAARHLLWAAWECDDRRDVDEARRHRSRAADLLLPFLSARPYQAEETDRRLRLIDLLRRSRRWDEALKLTTDLIVALERDKVMPEKEANARLRVAKVQHKLVVGKQSDARTVSGASAGEFDDWMEGLFKKR
jgi:hypothetical protein